MAIGNFWFPLNDRVIFYAVIISLLVFDVRTEWPKFAFIDLWFDIIIWIWFKIKTIKQLLNVNGLFIFDSFYLPLNHKLNSKEKKIFLKLNQHLQFFRSEISSFGLRSIPCFCTSPPNLDSILLAKLLNIEVSP